MKQLVKTSVVALIALLFCSASLRAQTPAPVWTWPAVPPCLGDPSFTPPSSPRASPAPIAPGGDAICTLYAAILTSPSIHILDVESARVANAAFGADYPSFEPGTAVLHFVVIGDIESVLRGPNRLVRVSSSAGGAKYGSWWTTLAQVSADGRTPNAATAISNVLALPSLPGCVAFGSHVMQGAQGYFGVVAKDFSQDGGGIEFWFPSGSVTVDAPVAQLTAGPPCQGL